MFIKDKVPIRGFFRRDLPYRERMVDYMDSWIRIFKSRLRNLQLEGGISCGEVALGSQMYSGWPFIHAIFDF